MDMKKYLIVNIGCFCFDSLFANVVGNSYLLIDISNFSPTYIFFWVELLDQQIRGTLQSRQNTQISSKSFTKVLMIVSLIKWISVGWKISPLDLYTVCGMMTSQTVFIIGSTSVLGKILCSVLQYSAPGPLLFNIFINDLKRDLWGHFSSLQMIKTCKERLIFWKNKYSKQIQISLKVGLNKQDGI